MTTLSSALVIVLLLAGLFFLTVSSVGLVRLPDFFSRTHAVGKSETLGAMLILLGLTIYNGWALVSVKILLVLLLVALTNPTGVHAVSRAALRSGVEIWTRKHNTGPPREEPQVPVAGGSEAKEARP